MLFFKSIFLIILIRTGLLSWIVRLFLLLYFVLLFLLFFKTAQIALEQNWLLLIELWWAFEKVTWKLLSIVDCSSKCMSFWTGLKKMQNNLLNFYEKLSTFLFGLQEIYNKNSEIKKCLIISTNWKGQKVSN